MTEAKIPEIRGLKEEPSQTKKCEAEHCLEDGIYPAPRNRDDLRSYVWFCLQHVREYNKGWNYFDGLNGDALEAEIRRATTWERPSWRFGTGGTDSYIRIPVISLQRIYLGFFQIIKKEKKLKVSKQCPLTNDGLGKFLIWSPVPNKKK